MMKILKNPLLGGFVSPLDGRLLSLQEVPDQVFSQKILGDGFAIEPANGKVVSPVDGTVTIIMDSKHAVGLTSHAGLEVIVHFGIDTVNLQGEGFKALVTAGDKVTAGQPLLEVDVNTVKDKVPTIITPIVFTNLTGQTVIVQAGHTVSRGEPIRLELQQ